MTLDDIGAKLDRIIALLEAQQAGRATSTAAADAMVREAVTRALPRLPAGRKTSRQIAAAAGLPEDLVTVRAVRRVMLSLGYADYRSSTERGFVIPVTGHRPGH